METVPNFQRNSWIAFDHQRFTEFYQTFTKPNFFIFSAWENSVDLDMQWTLKTAKNKPEENANLHIHFINYLYSACWPKGDPGVKGSFIISNVTQLWTLKAIMHVCFFVLHNLQGVNESQDLYTASDTDIISMSWSKRTANPLFNSLNNRGNIM